nr:MAG TPA: hypothetical protein [Caudoviricetes sp.]
MKKIKKFQQEYRGKSIYGTTASEERLYWLTVEFQSLEGERFLPQLVVVALAVVGTAIMVAIVAFLMDEE